jgi:hypothetical protein
MKKHLLLLLCALASIHSFAQTWEKLPGPYGGMIDHIASNDSVVVATVQHKGAYVSHNGGVSWTLAIDSSEIRQILVEEGLIVLTTTDGRLYYSTDNMHTIHFTTNFFYYGGLYYLHHGHLYVSEYYGVHESADTGHTWTSLPYSFSRMAKSDSALYTYTNYLNISWDNGATFTTDSAFNGMIQFIEADSNEAWLGMGNDVFHTADNGHHWTILYHAPYNVYRFKRAGNQFYLSDYQLEHMESSFDSGASWQTIPNSWPGWANDFSISQGKIYKATGRGISTCSDGTHWQDQNSGIAHVNINRMEFKDGKLFYNQWCGNLGYSSDLGNTWTTCNTIDSTMNGFYSYDYSDGKLFGVDPSRGFYISTDTGITWNAIPLEHSFFANDILYSDPVLIVPVLFFSEKIFQSTDLGTSWNESFINSFSGTGYARMRLEQSEKAIIYSRNYVYRSADNGLSWTNTGLPQSQYNKLSFSGDHFYAVSWGGIYRGDDSAETWLNVCPDTWMEYTAVSSHNNEVYVSTSHNTILYSFDDGNNWIKLDSLPYKITELLHEPPYLFVGTEDESIWRMYRGPQVNVSETGSAMMGLHIFPNPSGSVFQIRWSEAFALNATIRVFTAQGVEIMRRNTTGNTMMALDLSTYEKGVYFIRLDSSGCTSTRKLVLN